MRATVGPFDEEIYLGARQAIFRRSIERMDTGARTADA
jgi:hypothetical protein